jgi:peptide/nickel transport system substrate-binding protein
LLLSERLPIPDAFASLRDTFGASNAEYERLLARIRLTPPGPARRRQVTRAAEIVVATVPVLPLTDNLFVRAVRTSYTGWIHPPNGELYVHLLRRA